MKITKKKLNKSQKDKLITDLSSFFQKESGQIVSVYLFGSFITGVSFSDIDLGILTKKFIEKTIGLETDLENQLEKMIKCPVDIRILNLAPLSFRQTVIRYGQIILDRDPNFRADFEGKTLKQYFDFAYFRKQYLKEVINAPI